MQIEHIILIWFVSSVCVVLMTTLGVYMELTNPERKAIAEVTRLKEHIDGLQRANTIYSESIQSIIGGDDHTTVELSPNLLALMKEVFAMIQREAQQQEQNK